MIISHHYCIHTQLHELCLQLDKENSRFIYMAPDLKESEKFNGIVNWLNKCFKEYDEKETSE